MDVDTVQHEYIPSAAMEGKVFTPGNQSWCQGGSHVVIHRIILHKSSSLAFASGVPVIFKPEVKSPPSATLIWTAALSAVCCNPLYSCEYDLLHFRRTIFPLTLNFILRLLLSQYENPWLWYIGDPGQARGQARGQGAGQTLPRNTARGRCWPEFSASVE